MLEVYERLGTHCHEEVSEVVKLDSDQRDRGRLKLTSENGVDVRVFLERGKPLLVGEYLKSECGKIIQVQGAVESVAHASCEDWRTFSRACYHLGNRHTKIEVGERWLRIKPDHVLEEMLHLLGLVVTHEGEVFAPESGAYSKGGHSHSHGHSHDGHSHE
ncbi:urease accessory protein UreE [Oleiphilus sp. HI0081]|uniref:urease accessory protein UreE n=2 Tax=Oleiphilus TaxID=141450 RepID=UPI0007C36E87|nr:MULTISPECIES: urease accessory protein UreE [unclassified Oleiphilus]KZY77181.1 urease accessory protein UreE [Oleiphilus sp. HI0068]KZY79310.1 urease accessory protein UreE [Oleiphilus sp. HI0069]KZY87326.1 urease accessory protein UreE [Oleiphilus sp. HI0072]KZZ21041.1 urease accessory protein UreE [Oleiphilus sp. HI0078]KZZ22472.1 urease accessory protein UreE [Oleiphilus sp. HI0081]